METYQISGKYILNTAYHFKLKLFQCVFTSVMEAFIQTIAERSIIVTIGQMLGIAESLLELQVSKACVLLSWYICHSFPRDQGSDVNSLEKKTLRSHHLTWATARHFSHMSMYYITSHCLIFSRFVWSLFLPEKVASLINFQPPINLFNKSKIFRVSDFIYYQYALFLEIVYGRKIYTFSIISLQNQV